MDDKKRNSNIFNSEIFKLVILFLLFLIAVVLLLSVPNKDDSTVKREKKPHTQVKIVHETLLKKIKHTNEHNKTHVSSRTEKYKPEFNVQNISKNEIISALRKELENAPEVTQNAIYLARRMKEDFAFFKKEIIKISQDKNELPFMRMLMLEILHSAPADSQAQEAILDVFHEETPSSLLSGYAALYLTTSSENIKKELVDKFSKANQDTAPFYLHAIKQLKYDAAVNDVRDTLSVSNSFNTRLAAIEALGSLKDDDEQSTHMLLSIVKSKGDKKSATAQDEVEAMRATASLAELGEKNIDSLLGLAADAQLSIDVRMRAVESLSQIKTQKDEEIQSELSRIKTALTTEKLSEIEQKKLEFMISAVMNMKK